MKLSRITLPTLLLLLSCFSISLNAAPPPRTIGYQGYLKDGSGKPVTTMTSLTFRLYSTTSGVNPVWSETRRVAPVTGVYSVNLGDLTPLTIAFDRQYFLGVQAGSDPEFSPLQPLNSVPYALSAPLPPSSTVTTAAAGLEVTNTGTGMAIVGRDAMGNTGALGGGSEFTSSGAGVIGFSPGNGAAIFGLSAGTGSAGLFAIHNALSPASALYTETDGSGAALEASALGSGTAVYGRTSGTGKAADFRITNPDSTNRVLELFNSGTGDGALFALQNPASFGNSVTASNYGAGTALLATQYGTGSAGYFSIMNGANSSTVLQVTGNGAGNSVQATATGTGRAGSFLINNPANGTAALVASTNGTGRAADFRVTNPDSFNDVVYINQSGKGNALDVVTSGADANAASFVVNNPANPYNALYAFHQGTGAAIQGNTTGSGPALLGNSSGSGVAVKGVNSGTGRAADFRVTNSGSFSDVVYINQSGKGNGLTVVTSGVDANAASFVVNNLANTYNALYAFHQGTGAAIQGNTAGSGPALLGNSSGSGPSVRGENSGTGNAGSFLITSAVNASTVLTAATNGIGAAGKFLISSAINASPALWGDTAGSGPAGRFYSSGTGRGLDVWINNSGSTADGVHVETNSFGSAGWFYNSGSGGNGVYGQTSGTSGTAGVSGYASNSTGTTYGVYGRAASNTSYGVYGNHLPTGNYGYLGTNAGGAYGFNSSSSSYGMLGHSSGGVYGYSLAGNGVKGETGNNIAVYGVNNSTDVPAVEGWNQGTGYIFKGWSGAPGSHTLKFYVANNGALYAVSKSFRIDHPLDPLNKTLNHVSVESPDMKNIYDGVITTDERGYAVVSLPEWFDALNKEFRYQLTVIDEADSSDFVQTKVVKGIQGNSFTIRTSAPSVSVSWQVTGIRKDAWAEANRIQVEVEKPAAEKGTCIYPEACR